MLESFNGLVVTIVFIISGRFRLGLGLSTIMIGKILVFDAPRIVNVAGQDWVREIGVGVRLGCARRRAVEALGGWAESRVNRRTRFPVQGESLGKDDLGEALLFSSAPDREPLDFGDCKRW